MNPDQSARWRAVGAKLEIPIVAPFVFEIEGHSKVAADAFVPSFGTARGMLIFGDFALIEKLTQSIDDQGFGFSVMSLGQDEDPEDVMDVLRDWGWMGAKALMPCWLK